MTDKKTKPVCTKCGSDEVNVDAYARWNTDTQDYEILTTFDKGHSCEQCGGECRIEWINVPDRVDPKAGDMVLLGQDHPQVIAAKKYSAVVAKLLRKPMPVMRIEDTTDPEGRPCKLAVLRLDTQPGEICFFLDAIEQIVPPTDTLKRLAEPGIEVEVLIHDAATELQLTEEEAAAELLRFHEEFPHLTKQVLQAQQECQELEHVTLDGCLNTADLCKALVLKGVPFRVQPTPDDQYRIITKARGYLSELGETAAHGDGR